MIFVFGYTENCGEGMEGHGVVILESSLVDQGRTFRNVREIEYRISNKDL